MNAQQPVAPSSRPVAERFPARWSAWRTATPLLLAALLAIGAGGPQTAEVTAGPERRLASAGLSPSIVIDDPGRAVVVWLGSNLDAVIGRRLVGDVPQGRAFQVNSISRGGLRDPKVSMDAQGGFVVVWSDLTPAPQARTTIRGQLFDADGGRHGRELALSPRDVFADSPQVSMAADGRFAVAYDQAPGDPRQTVRLATFGADGTRLASPRVMRGLGTLANLVGAVSASEGSVAVAWTEYTPCPSNPIDPVSAVMTLDWALVPLREVDRLANDNPCVDGPVVKAMPNSGEGPLGVFEGRRYSIQRFSPVDGKRVGLRINVAEFPACGRCEEVEAVAGDTRGRFVFVWERVRYVASTGFRYELFGQLFGRDGQPSGERFKITHAPSSTPQRPAAALAADGTLLVTWQRSGEAILLRRFQLDG
jgi:hypothetical protein